MADPDIRRMGKKHKKHKKEYSQYHNIRLPGFLPERVPMPEEPVNEMKVVLKLPRPMENHNGRLRFTPPIITQHRHGHGDVHHSRPSWGSSLTIPPHELIVSIPFTALCQQEEEEPLEPEAEPVAAIAEHEGEQLHHSSHHKHKKHKKHKIKKHHHHHHQHDSAPQEEVRGRFGGPETMYPPVADVIKQEPSSSLRNMAQLTPIGGTIKTVAPLKIQVPKPSPPLADASGRTLSKHKTHSHSHHEESSVLVPERHGQPPPGALPSGKHMHTTTTTHKHHHHKHKEKRHHHHHRSSGYQGDEHVTGYHGNEDVIGGGGGEDDDDDDDFDEQGQAVVMKITPPTRPLGGKPTAFMKTVEEKKKFTSNEYSPMGGTSEKIQTSSHEGHKHHKKKKKKHHKHSKHSFSHSEPEVSPPVARLSVGMESEASQLGPGQQFTTTTPLLTGGGSRSTTTTAQAHAHPVAIPQDMPGASREPTFTRSSSKEGKKLLQEGSGVVGHSSFRETRRLSQDSDSGSSGYLPLRRLSEDKRTPKKLEAQSPDVLPPPAKRSRMDDEKPPLPPSLKFDISQTKGLDFELRDTPSPATTGAQFELSSLRHQTSHESSDSVASTPVTVAKSSMLGEARRSSVGAVAIGGGGGERAQHQGTSAAMAPSPPVMQNPAEMKTAQVRLSKDTLQLFLKNLHHLIQRRDPDGIFAEPVTDDIAPGYSALISIPMDLTTVAKKIDMGQYESVGDFKSDFILMCNNAMTYNAPETVYYASAKRLLTTGLQIIAKETSLRPDIRHGTTALIPSRSVSPTPLPLDTPPINIKVDYSSPFLCRVDLSLLRGTSGAVTRSAGGAIGSLMMGGVLPLSEQPECISVDVNGLSDITNQSHLTKVIIGFEDEVKEASVAAAAAGGEDELEPEEDVFSSLAPESPEEILAQVEEAAELMKENLDSSNRTNVKFTFLNQDESGKTMLNVLNPDTGSVDVSSPLDLTTLNDFVRMGNNAATVLKTELPLMRATPVSYLMYGPFGSFAPAYDSSFATLTKMDSDLLLQSYGSELGVSYAHSLQQFVKGSGSFVTEMADAVLNGLTNNRHSKFMAKFREFEERERKLRETPASTSSSGATASLSRDGSLDNETEKSPTSAEEEGEGTEKSPTSAKEEEGSTTPIEGKDEAIEKTTSSPDEEMDTSEPAAQDSASKQGSITSDDSRGSPLEGETLLHLDNDTHDEATGTPPPPALPPHEGSEDSNNSSFDKNTSEDRRNSSDSVGSSPRRKPLLSGVEGGGEVSSLSGEASAGVVGGDLQVVSLERTSSTTTMTSSSSNSSSTPATPLPLPLALSAASGGTEPVGEEDEPMEQGKVDIGGKLDEEAAILLGDLEDIGSLGSPSEEGAPVISGATSESNSRLTSPASVEPLQTLDLIDEAPLDADIDSQLEHTSHLLGQLEEEQRDRLSQAPLELDDGHLVLPGPSDEEVRIASDLRAGLAQLTAQARPRDVVSVPALHDAMGISIETVAPEEGGPGKGEEEGETEDQQQEQVDLTQTTTTATASSLTGDNNETEPSNQQ